MKITAVSISGYQARNGQLKKESNARFKNMTSNDEYIKKDSVSFKGDGGALKGIVKGGLLGAAAVGIVAATGGLAALAAAGVTTAAAVGGGAAVGANIGGIIGAFTDDSTVEDVQDSIANALDNLKNKLGL